MHFIMPRFFINCERWKWNDDLRIYVSTYGHIKDEHKKNVAAKINGKGYFVVCMNHKVYTVHRLVLMTWRPLPNDGTPMTVDHLDSNRRNNHLENLEWVSQEENWKRANEKLLNDKVASKCDSCTNYAPVKIIEKLGHFVRWDELYEKFGYEKLESGFPEGFIEKIKELWINGEVIIYKGQSHSKITYNMLIQAIGNQPDVEKMVERFLQKSINRTGKYLGFNPWMRWSK